MHHTNHTMLHHQHHHTQVASLATLNERLSKLASGLRVENSGLQGALDRAAAERQCLEAAAALASCRAQASASERVVAEVAGVSRGQAQLVALVQELREDLMGLVPAAHASSAAEGGLGGAAGRAASAPCALPAVTAPAADAAAAAAAARCRSHSEPLADGGAGSEETLAAPAEAAGAVRVASVRGGVNSALAATVCDTLAL
jgi:hypothetical protein